VWVNVPMKYEKKKTVDVGRNRHRYLELGGGGFEGKKETDAGSLSLQELGKNEGKQLVFTDACSNSGGV